MSLHETGLGRKSSIKSRLRNISINRHKAAHFEEEPETIPIAYTETGSDGSNLRDKIEPVVTEGVEYTRGRSQSRASEQEKEQRIDSTLSTNSSLAEPQLAKPIVVTPTFALTEPIADTSRRRVNSVAATIENHDTESSKVDIDTIPIGATGGFLNSVFNAASNLGTVLGGTNQKRSTPIKVVGIAEGGGHVTSAVEKVPNTQVVGHESGTPIGSGQLSLKDMGLTDSHELRSSSPSPNRPRASSQPSTNTGGPAAESDATLVNRPFRSGSVATTQSRNRRGSTAMSVFSGSEGTGQKITGFAVASNKRNREFHATFRSVPDADYLLDDYGCALQKEILVHGRMYVSESHICFNSNIFGWVTNLVIAFADIIAIEKKSTAGIFPNAIQISTLQAKHVFASFISRDTTFDLIVNIWRLTHPLIQTTAHGVEIASTDGDDLYESETNTSDGSSGEDESGDESDVDNEVEAVVIPGRASDNNRESPTSSPTRVATVTDVSEEGAFPGPREHIATEAPSLSDGTAYAKALLDESFDAPLGKLYELLFGDDSTFMQDFLNNNQKLLDVAIGQFSDRGGKSMRSTSYVKPLSGPIGPKQTRCLLEDLIEIKDFDKCVQVVQSTTSPDVPSGDAFVIKTRFSLMWGANNTTRLVTNCVIEWSKNSWIKGPIEKGSNAGQLAFMADLSEALKSHLALSGMGRKRKSKGRKSKNDSEVTKVVVANTSHSEDKSSRGLLGALSGVIENINMTILVFVLLFGMTVAMVRMQNSIRLLAETAQGTSKGQSLAHVQWQHGETDLWDWLATRTVGVLENDRGVDDHVDSTTMTALQLQEALQQVQAQATVLEKAQQLANKQNSKTAKR